MKIYFINDLHWDFWKREGYTLEKYFDQYFLPADVCCVAGDIANDFDKSAEILKYLKSRYFKVVYTLGNHDYGIFNKDKYKLNLLKTEQKKHAFSKKVGPHLDGTIMKVNGVTFGGGCGSCDWTWAKQNFKETDDTDFFNRWQEWFDGRWWKMSCNAPMVLFNHEIEKLKTVAEQKPDIFVTHFQPMTCPIADPYKNDIMTGMFVFDDSQLNLKPGTIYHFGHTHSKLKMEQNGITYLNNCIGYPEEIFLDAFGKFEKEDFLIEVEDKNDRKSLLQTGEKSEISKV